MEEFSLPTGSTDYGFISDGKVIRKAFLHYPDKAIGEVKDTDQAALLYFAQRFNIFAGKLKKLFLDIEHTQNKGSYLVKIIHLKDHLHHIDALGDFEALQRLLVFAEHSINALVAHNRIKNTEIKFGLIEEIKSFGYDNNWRGSHEKMTEIRERWLKTGIVSLDQEHAVLDAFQDALDDFYERRKLFYDDRQIIIDEREAEYLKIAAEMRGLIRSDMAAPVAIKYVRPLQQRWKEVGSIPKPLYHPIWLEYAEDKKQLINNFKNAKKQLRDKRGGSTGFGMSRDNPIMKMVYEREAVCREIEQFESEPDLRRVLDKVKELQAKWREMPSIPPSHKNQLISRFTLACDRIFEFNNLQRICFQKNHFIRTRPLTEQLNMRLEIMDEVIIKQKGQIDFLEKSLTPDSEDAEEQAANQMVLNRIRTEKRRLLVKYKIQDEIRVQFSKAEELENMS